MVVASMMTMAAGASCSDSLTADAVSDSRWSASAVSLNRLDSSIVKHWMLEKRPDHQQVEVGCTMESSVEAVL